MFGKVDGWGMSFLEAQCPHQQKGRSWLNSIPCVCLSVWVCTILCQVFLETGRTISAQSNWPDSLQSSWRRWKMRTSLGPGVWIKFLSIFRMTTKHFLCSSCSWENRDLSETSFPSTSPVISLWSLFNNTFIWAQKRYSTRYTFNLCILFYCTIVSTDRVIIL